MRLVRAVVLVNVHQHRPCAAPIRTIALQTWCDSLELRITITHKHNIVGTAVFEGAFIDVYIRRVSKCTFSKIDNGIRRIRRSPVWKFIKRCYAKI